MIANIPRTVTITVETVFSTIGDWVSNRVSAIHDAIMDSGPTGVVGPGGPSVGVGGNLSKQAQADIDRLVSLGWTRAQATGLAANVLAESGGKGAAAVGDSGSAYGILQWHSDRQRAFELWAGHSIKGATRDEQLRFIDYELRSGSEQRAGQALARTTSAPEAARVASTQYVRPKNVAADAANRMQIADSLAAKPLPPVTPIGARTTAVARNVSNDSRQSHVSTSTSEVNVGAVNVYPPNGDAKTIAASIKPALKRTLAAAHAQGGFG